MVRAGWIPRLWEWGPQCRHHIEQALNRAGVHLNEIQLLELNEAFTHSTLGVMRELASQYGLNQAWFEERTNVKGGAIALRASIGGFWRGAFLQP